MVNVLIYNMIRPVPEINGPRRFFSGARFLGQRGMSELMILGKT